MKHDCKIARAVNSAGHHHPGAFTNPKRSSHQSAATDRVLHARASGRRQVRLRLHNNSRWAISFRTEQPVEITVPFRLADGREVKALIEGALVSPQYVIDNPMIGGSSAYSCSSFEQWLTPGTSSLMSVPVEKLKPIAYFYVTFRYEWGGDGHEPEHRVRFEYYPETKVPGDN